MAITQQIPRNTSTAAPGATVFPYDFKILLESDILVQVNGDVKALGVDYTVAGAGVDSGGSITFLTPMIGGETVIRRRAMKYDRLTDFQNLGDLRSATLNNDQDAPVMMIQQLADGTIQLVLDPGGSGEFVWDAKGARIIRVGDATALSDAMNMRSTLTLVEQIQAGGGSVGVTPLVWSWEGDGESIDFPLPGADVDSPLFYDTAMGVALAPETYTVLKPGVDFEIRMGPTPADTVIRMLGGAPDIGVKGFTVLRGYARPYIGDEPVTTVAPTIITTITGDTTIGADFHNTLIVLNSATPVTLTIRENTGDADLDWGNGEFFSVLQFGAGQVTLAPEGAGTVTPPADFENKTRAAGSIISASCVAEDSDLWASSGDLLRTAVEPTRQVIRLIDRSVLSATNITVANGKDQFVLPHDIQLDSIADGGVIGSLNVAQAAGSTLQFDIKVGPPGGTMASIFATLPTFDNAEFSTGTAATPAVYSSNFLAAHRIIPAGYMVRLDVIRVGTALAKCLSVGLTGTRAS